MLKKIVARIKKFIKTVEVKSLIALIPAIIFFCLSYSNPFILSFSILGQFALPIIAIIACLVSGRDFLNRGYVSFRNIIRCFKQLFSELRTKELRAKINYKKFFSSLSSELNMDSLVTLSIVSSLFYAVVLGSLAPIVIYAAPLFTLAALHVSNALKQFINNWTGSVTRKKIDALLAEKKAIEELIISKTEDGDELTIKSDESKSTYIPVDGWLLSEKAEINEGTLVSGEADKTVVYLKGKLIYAGTRYVGSGEIKIKACYAGSKSNIYKKIQSIVSYSKAVTKRSVNKYLDQISKWFVPVILLIAIIAFVVWSFIAGFGFGFAVAMDILFAACPCALAIAGSTPYAFLKAMLFNNNIVIHDESFIDQLDTVDTVVFDKTGTLTTLSVKDIVMLNTSEESKLPLDKNLILNLVKHAERCKLKLKKEQKDGFIKDNFAEAIVSSDKFPEPEPSTSNVEDFIQDIDLKSQHGLIINIKKPHGAKIFVGSASFLTQQGIACDIDLGNPAVFIGVESSGSKILLAQINFDQQVREDAKSTIDLLKARKIAVHMLTGDNLQSAKLIATELGIDVENNIKADCKISPTSESTLGDKATYVAALVKKGRKVLVVGDGWNDAEAAGQANAGSLAMGLTSDMSGFFSGTIDKLSDIFKLKAAFAKFKLIQKQVLAFSVLYIFLAMFLAAVVFPMYGMVTMMGCFGICMAFSSCFALAWSSLLIPLVKKVLHSPKKETASPASVKPVIGHEFAHRPSPASRPKTELYTLYKKSQARSKEDPNKTWYRFEVTKETFCCQMDARKGKCTEIENEFGLTRDSLRFDKNKIEFDCQVDDKVKNAIRARLVELFDTEKVVVALADGADSVKPSRDVQRAIAS